MAIQTFYFFLLDSITQNGNSANWTYLFNPAAGTSVSVDFGPNNVPDPNETVTLTIGGFSYSTHYDGFADMGGSTISFDVITLTALDGGPLDGNQYGISTDITWAPNISTSVGSALDPNHYTTFCFVAGTRLSTPTAAVSVEHLEIGDTVLTRDNGPQKVSWVGKRKMFDETAKHLLPVRIEAGALGNGLPERDLLVSPQHRILLSDWRAELMFGTSEVLVAAKHLINDTDIRVASDLAEFEYYHVMFESHQTIFSEGLPTESFHPGDMAMKSLSEAARAEVFEIFPELAGDVSTYGSSTHLSLKSFEAKALSA